MEEALGLGFDVNRGAAPSAAAFVSAAATDVKDIHDISHYAANTSSLTSGGVIANEGGGGTSSSSEVANAAMHIDLQQQQYHQPQQIPPQFPPPPPPHLTAPTTQTTMHYSQPHNNPQMQLQPPSFPPPSSTLPVQPPPPHFPIPPPMQQPPPIPNATFQPVPSFQPPPGLPPGAAPYFPPLPSNSVAPVPPAPIPLSLPQPPVAPSTLPSQVTATQQLQHSGQTTQQQPQPEPQNDPIAKARAIAMRLHQDNMRGGIIDDATIDGNIDYAQKRKDHFEKETRRLQTFRLKNLEFVMKHEEQELRRHVECMNQMTAYEEKQQLQLELQQQQQRQRQLQLEQKQQEREQRGILNDAGGGIGSKDQRHAERARTRQHMERGAGSGKYGKGNGNTSKTALRTSLYLTNLPTDRSTTERTLQSLFCMYGRLDRVTMYRHRSTRELKGDGLIVFGRDAAEEYRTKNGDGADLVEAVCTQMNGAELPCGAIIGVQPADDDYKKKAKRGDHPEHITPSGRQSVKSLPMPGAEMTGDSKVISKEDEVAENDEEDLDDFFASLE